LQGKTVSSSLRLRLPIDLHAGLTWQIGHAEMQHRQQGQRPGLALAPASTRTPARSPLPLAHCGAPPVPLPGGGGRRRSVPVTGIRGAFPHWRLQGRKNLKGVRVNTRYGHCQGWGNPIRGIEEMRACSEQEARIVPATPQEVCGCREYGSTIPG
jgi:hypothetical protein